MAIQKLSQELSKANSYTYTKSMDNKGKKVNFWKGNWIFTYYNLSLEVLTLNNVIKWFLISWSWWPSSLRHGSAATRLLGLRVWAPRGAWMSVLWVLCFGGIDLCDGLITCRRTAIQERVTAVLRSIPKEACADSFQKLYERCQPWVVKDGDYFEVQ
jgi:hypothetical protein